MIQIRDYKTDKFKTYIPKDKAKRLCTATDIMIGRYGPPIFQILRGLEGAYNVALMKAIPNNNIVSNDYLYYLLQDGELLYMLEGLSDRTCGQDGINMYELNRYIVGIPPVSEQNRIIEFLSNSISIVNTIISEKGDLLSIIQLTKSKILDLAIRGKLVPQNPNDEPANVLLDRIRAEKQELIKQGKIKPDKRDSVIFKGEDNSYYEKIRDDTYCIDDEIPFELPDNWSWCRLQACCIKDIKRGKSPKYADNSNTLVFAQKCNTKYDGINLELSLYLDESTLLKYSEEEYLRDLDIIINSTGTGTLGRVGIYRVADNIRELPIVPDSHVTVIRTYSYIHPEYMYYYLKSIQTELEKMGEGSTNQKELKPATLKELLVPIPSIEEQKRIVECVKLTFSKLSYIEHQFN